MEDKRFENILRDPKFRRIPKNQSKIKIDKRFESMFTDKKFQVKYTVDKRGRPSVHHSSEDLKRYYDLSSDEDEKNDPEETKKASKSESDGETDLNKPHENDAKLPDAIKKKLRDLTVDYARGESKLLSDSSSDDEESEDEEVSETDEIDHKWGELDADAASTEEITRRLAACNMDWDRIRAIDLMVLFSSFLPSGGVIQSVVIYPSEFGKQRMKEEEVKGPIELVESKKDDHETEREEGSKYHMEKLRQYQLNRLKYYYAVVTFDDANSANKIYTECDGMEYESSATKIDLRFIPDDMEFTDEPKESCTTLPDAKKYEPRFFTTSALQQAKVNLTWDETDPGRIEFSQKINSGKLDSITDEDLQNYLAGSSDEEENEEEEEENEFDDGNDAKSDVEKYKALLKDIEEKSTAKNNKDVEMEVSWGIDLKEKTEKLAKQKREGDKTPFELYLEKRKEKRKEKREKKKKQSENEEEEEEENVDSDIPSDIDMNDPYFAEEFKKSEFTKKKAKKHDIVEQNKNDDELELLLMNEDNKKHFNLTKIQEQENTTKKKKKKNKKNKQTVVKEEEEQQDEFKVNVADERFSALFTSHHFNIDPTDPHYKKTKGMETLISEKLKRRNDETVVSTVKKQKIAPKKNTELAMLVKSVKNKTKGFKNKRNA